MTGLSKFLLGVAGTSLLAWGANAVGGPAYIDGLEESAQTTFGGLDLPDGAEFEMQRSPLARVAVVSGVTDQADQERIRAAMLGVAGVKDVQFAGSGEGAGESDRGADRVDGATDGDAPQPAEVVTCQSDLDEVMASKSITFRSGSAYMPDSSLRVVDEVADVLSRCPDVRIIVEGHTDATGSDAINRTMSAERANRVATALTERGVDAGRITAEGKGSAEPIVEGTGAQANAANRRIAFVVSAGTDAAAPEGE